MSCGDGSYFPYKRAIFDTTVKMISDEAAQSFDRPYINYGRDLLNFFLKPLTGGRSAPVFDRLFGDGSVYYEYTSAFLIS